MSYPEILKQIDLLKMQIEAAGLLPEEVRKRIGYKFRLEWNYFSNSMEGNTLTKDETRSVMVGNITVAGKPIKDVLEVKGHDKVISEILRIGKGEVRLSEARIKQIHRGIMHEEDPEKQKEIGVWKQQPNYLYNYKNERFDFVSPADVPARMHDLLNKTNAALDAIWTRKRGAPHPVDLAVQFHLEYVLIHPFYDGNGRTARVLTNLLLISLGYPPFWVKTEERSMYMQYLADIQGYGGAPDLFYAFAGNLILRSQQLVLSAIEGKNIDDPTDVDKEISMLVQRATSFKTPLKKRNFEFIQTLYNQFGKELFTRFIEKHLELEKLFVSHEYSFGIGMQYQNRMEWLDEELARISIVGTENEHEYLVQHLTASVRLKELKGSVSETFSTQNHINFGFEQYSFSIRTIRNSWTFGYDKIPDSDLMSEIITDGIRALLSQIESHLK